MALIIKPKLRRFQFVDAFITAPASMGVIEIALRLASTCYEGRYGKEQFGVLVIGDDPLLSLCVAVHHLRMGETVLIAPDSLSPQNWPGEDWGNIRANIHAHFDDDIGCELMRHMDGLSDADGLQKALSLLIQECASSGKVAVLNQEYLQSSSGHIKGDSRKIWFPLPKNSSHAPSLNPLWSLVTRKLRNISFNHSEIEFIHSDLTINTSPVSSFIDPGLCKPVGPACSTGSTEPSRVSRVDDIRSAFSLFQRNQ